MEDIKDNAIEWITGEERMTVSLTQQKYITRIKKLALDEKNGVEIKENADGSIVAHLPLKALHLNVKKGHNKGFGRNAESEDEEDECSD